MAKLHNTRKYNLQITQQNNKFIIIGQKERLNTTDTLSDLNTRL